MRISDWSSDVCSSDLWACNDEERQRGGEPDRRGGVGNNEAALQQAILPEADIAAHQSRAGAEPAERPEARGQPGEGEAEAERAVAGDAEASGKRDPANAQGEKGRAPVREKRVQDGNSR